MGVWREGRGRVVALCAVLVGACGCASSGPVTRPTSASAVTARAPATSLAPATTAAAGGPLAELASLPTTPTGRVPDYRRAAFGPDGWDYDPASGCNTRDRVLIAESARPPTMGARCKVLAGQWTSLYDGVSVTDPHLLQIDHLIPLADAWRSGAAGWSPDRRQRFANDLSAPDTLIAVTGRTNESKGDDTPDEWLPPARSAWCTYARDWVDVKARWQLSVTGAERRALAAILAVC